MEFKRKEEIIAALIGEPKTIAMRQEKQIAERAPGRTAEVQREADELSSLADFLATPDYEPDPFTEAALHSRIFTRLEEREAKAAPLTGNAGSALAAVLATAIMLTAIVLNVHPEVQYNRAGESAIVAYDHSALSYQLEQMQNLNVSDDQYDDYYDYEEVLENLDEQSAEMMIGIYSPSYFYANLSGAGLIDGIYDLQDDGEQG
jgi:hypothetical protein